MNEVLLKSVVPRIGSLLRFYREKMDKNQVAIADCAGISTSMLSQIERGVVSPSIDTLVLVCKALEIEIADLFRHLAIENPVRIHKAGTRVYFESMGVRYERLLTGSVGGDNAEMLLLSIKPGAKTTLTDQGHDGLEMGYVQQGRARLIVDGVEHEITEGDSITFSAHLPHRINNTGDEIFKAVWFVSPPHMDYLVADTPK